jgi:protein tyrosine phosphatase (PTP) superfamily phosphohydrolase (DUF442 family)
LGQLKQAGFDAVVHIAAISAQDGVEDEGALVGGQAMAYVRIAVDPDSLTTADMRAVSAALAEFADRRVLAHCDRNVLTSSLVFLYRVLERREAANRALADVERVWVMHGAVREFVHAQLRGRGIDLDALQ